MSTNSTAIPNRLNLPSLINLDTSINLPHKEIRRKETNTPWLLTQYTEAVHTSEDKI